MNNSFLKYMSDNNPENTISKNGVMVRNKIRPLLWKMLALSNKLKLEIEKKELKELIDQLYILHLIHLRMTRLILF